MKNSPQITPAQIEDLRTGNGKPLDYIPPVYTDELTARLDAPISEIRNLAQVAKTHFVRAVLMDFKSGKYEKQVLNVQAIHRAEGRSNRYTAAKKELPAFTFGGTFADTRANKNLRFSSGLVICDLDEQGDRLEDCFKKVCNDRHVLAAWKSPSGNGIKFLVAIPSVKDDSEYKSFLRPLEKYFKQTHGIFLEFGKDGSDIARNCFACYDPDLYLAESVELFTEKSPYNQPKTKAELKPGKPSQVHFQNSEFAKNAIDACLGIIKRSFPPDNSRPGNRHRSRLTAGILAGGYIAGGILNENQVIPLLESAVSANTTLKLETAFKDVLDGIEYGKQAPITQEQKEAERQTWIKEHYSKFENEQRAGQNSNNDRKRAETGQDSPISQGGGEYIPKAKFKTLREIQQTDLPPVKWIVKDLLPEGYAILASRPKMGKSWMALQLALAVANGYRALGKFETVKGNILYFDVDQGSQRAIKSRLDQQLLQFPDDERFAPENVFWANSINRLEDGGEYELKAQIEKYKPSLVIIDTLRKFAPVDQKNQGYQGEYDLGVKIHETALQYGICILCVHHTTKASFQYVADEISGTSGVTASADTLLSIRQTLNGVELYAVGREVFQENYIIQFDKQTGLWNVVGNAAEFVGGNTLGEQLAQLIFTIAQGEYDLSIGDYAAILGKKRNHVDKELKRLREKGLLVTTAERGKHALNPGVTIAEEITENWKSKIEKYLS